MKNIFFTDESVKIDWFNSEKYFFTDESVKRQITDLIGENLTDSDLENRKDFFFKFHFTLIFWYLLAFHWFQVTVLLREGLAFYRINHPTLLTILGVSIEESGAPFLLYPYTAYKNMKRFLLRCKLSSEGPPRALTTQEVVEMALQAAKGVQYLHRKKFIHKDVAARNCV